ncbi:hypothetical protein RZS08_15585, partial [Arthrospira platensis SPKY1]|nr:hypothetical protein [Arthrospira platensis SPKY1]
MPGQHHPLIQGLGDVAQQPLAVGQSGQGVKPGQPFQPFLGRPLRGDVHLHRDVLLHCLAFVAKRRDRDRLEIVFTPLAPVDQFALPGLALGQG